MTSAIRFLTLGAGFGLASLLTLNAHGCPTLGTSAAGHVYCPSSTITGTIKVTQYDPDDAKPSGWLYISADIITIEEGAIINANGSGHRATTTTGSGPGAGETEPIGTDKTVGLPGGGGAHIGAGGAGREADCNVYPGIVGGVPYDSAADPFTLQDMLVDPGSRMGSSGGTSHAGGANQDDNFAGASGGGVVILAANQIVLNGRIEANGQEHGTQLKGAGPGGGAGGTIILITKELLAGPNAVLSAAGSKGGVGDPANGDPSTTFGGGGGGGLIVLYVDGDTSALRGRSSVAAGDFDAAVCADTQSGEPGEIAQFPAPECLDSDSDGHLAADCGTGDDCNDFDPTVFPGAPEICNGIDDDCNGLADVPVECEPGQPEDTCCHEVEPPNLGPDGPRIALHGGLCTSAPAGAEAGSRRPTALAWFAALAAIGLRRRRR